MLREIKKVRQIDGEPERRWFNGSDMDLILWHDDNELTGFQICYNKSAQEKALSWKKDSGFSHQLVDDGESRSGHYKATPILLQSDQINIKKIRTDFKKYSKNISDDVKGVILSLLSEGY